MKKEMPRVEIARPMIGICHMSVCAVKDATDIEILSVCNAENSSGTTNGWVSVIREDYTSDSWPAEKMRPVQCQDYPDRLHILVGC